MACKRLCIVASIVAFLSFVGLPVWLSTTSIARPAFPIDAEETFSAFAARGAALPVTLRLHVIHTRDKQPRGLAGVIAAAHSMTDLLQDDWRAAHGLGEVGVTVMSVELSECRSRLVTADASGQADTGCAAAEIADAAQSGPALDLARRLKAAAALAASRPGTYDVFALDVACGGPAGQGFVTDARVAWLCLGPESSDAQQAALLSDTLRTLLGSELRDASLPTSAASETTLSFSLCDAGGWPPASWDFGPWDEAVWQPLRRRLAPLLELRVESRVVLYAAARVRPRRSPDGVGTTVPVEQLSFFVDSDAWALDFGRTAAGLGADDSAAPGRNGPAMAAAAGGAGGDGVGAATRGRHGVPHHVLNFVAYVPLPEDRPLRFWDEERGRAHRSFATPAWGGVAVVNDGDGRGHAASADAAERELSSHAMHAFATAATLQLRQLLGLPGASDGGPRTAVALLAVEAEGVALWELDALMRRRFGQLQSETVDTVLSLLQLVKSLPNLEMPVIISDNVREAGMFLEQARSAEQAGSYEAAMLNARQARLRAEVAFMHHSIMALHNYPDQHTLAVYMPLFLPLAIPLCQAVVLELRLLKGKLRGRAA